MVFGTGAEEGVSKHRTRKAEYNQFRHSVKRNAARQRRNLVPRRPVFGIRLSAQALHPGRSCRAATKYETIERPQHVAGSAHFPEAHPSGGGCHGQQDGAHGLGRALKRRSLSASTFGENGRSLKRLACN